MLNVRKQLFCFVLFCSVLAGSGVGAIITDRYAHQSIKCQYKSQFLVAEGKCMHSKLRLVVPASYTLSALSLGQWEPREGERLEGGVSGEGPASTV